MSPNLVTSLNIELAVNFPRSSAVFVLEKCMHNFISGAKKSKCQMDEFALCNNAHSGEMNIETLICLQPTKQNHVRTCIYNHMYVYTICVKVHFYILSKDLSQALWHADLCTS